MIQSENLSLDKRNYIHLHSFFVLYDCIQFVDLKFYI